MGRIIRLHADDHLDIAELLPWYVTGRLETVELARVEAHLAGCAECRADVLFQRQLGAEIAALPTDIDQGWRSLRRRIEQESRPFGLIGSGLAWIRRSFGRVGRRAPGLGWALASVLVLAMSGAALVSTDRRPAYHALGATQPSPVGNVIVMFRPDTVEKSMRDMMTADRVRLVDGPTAAGAYILQAPADRRETILRKWRARSDILLAQPIDGPAP